MDTAMSQASTGHEPVGTPTDPQVEMEFLLGTDRDRLRPFNIDATRRMGFIPRLLPPRARRRL